MRGLLIADREELPALVEEKAEVHLHRVGVRALGDRLEAEREIVASPRVRSRGAAAPAISPRHHSIHSTASRALPRRAPPRASSTRFRERVERYRAAQRSAAGRDGGPPPRASAVLAAGTARASSWRIPSRRGGRRSRSASRTAMREAGVQRQRQIRLGATARCRPSSRHAWRSAIRWPARLPLSTVEM